MSDQVTVLAKQLEHRSPEVRFNAVRSLCGMGSAASPAGPALVGALDDPEGGVRCLAARALGTVGDASAVPALNQARGDRYIPARVAVACAIAGIARRGY